MNYKRIAVWVCLCVWVQDVLVCKGGREYILGSGNSTYASCQHDVFEEFLKGQRDLNL